MKTTFLIPLLFLCIGTVSANSIQCRASKTHSSGELRHEYFATQPDKTEKEEKSEYVEFDFDKYINFNVSYKPFHNGIEIEVQGKEANVTYSYESPNGVLSLEMAYLGTYYKIHCEEGHLVEVNCEVNNENEAKECLEIWAKMKAQKGERPHSVAVSESHSSKKAFQKILGTNTFDSFVGFVQVHDKDKSIYYLSLNKGENVTPKLYRKTHSEEIILENSSSKENLQKLNRLYSLEIDDLENFNLK